MKDCAVSIVLCLALVFALHHPGAAAAQPLDDNNRAIARYGTPVVDGTIDTIWDSAGILVPQLKSGPGIEAAGEFRILWDDTALYALFVVRDPVLNDSSVNTYEQDSVEVFLDEDNDKALSYQSDEVHYRVNYKNSQSTDAGAPHRFFSAASLLQDESGQVVGYIVETGLLWAKQPAPGKIMGFELQINDADAKGRRIGTVNLFDPTGTAWSNPACMGEIILANEGQPAAPSQYKGMLYSWITYVGNINEKAYVNSQILVEPLAHAKAVFHDQDASQEVIDAAETDLRRVVGELSDGSGFTPVPELEENHDLPDAFTFFSGEPVELSQWEHRAEELRKLYQYYMYGVMPDPTRETVGYALQGNELTITVVADDKSVSFPVTVQVPSLGPAPIGGYPVIIAFGWLGQAAMANDRGYAVITVNTQLVAADNLTRDGVFYELYPYGDNWEDQTGTLMAWSWGISKVLDALEKGAAEELGINPQNSIVTGVSRWGKAAAVAGAFDTRIRVTMPACSGSGGMASFRYKSEGKIYDYSPLGETGSYLMTANEPLGSLQSSAEKHWFNDNFLKFSHDTALPFDQHLLALLCVDKTRHLLITGSYLYEDWTNPPGMWVTYLAAKKALTKLGLGDNIGILLHKQGHMVTDEDLEYLLDYCDYRFFGKPARKDLGDLSRSLYLEPENYDPYFAQFGI